MRISSSLAAIATASALALSAAPAAAQSAQQPAARQPELDGFLGHRVRLTLTNGEVVRGELTALADGAVHILHPIFGEIALARAMVANVALDQQPNATIPTPQPEPEAPETVVPPPPTSLLEGWKGTVEFGLNGSSGNTERVNLRAGLGATRKTNKIETSLNFTYVWAKDEGDNTENRARVDLRNDWLLGDDSPWRAFLKGSFEFDEFQDWDTRLSVFGGLGYEFIDTSETFLLGRIGAGVTREFGGDDNDVMPEGLLGLDFRHALTERQQINATAEFLPDLDDVGQFRAIGRASYDILIDPEANLKLKIGVEDRYDSDPGDGYRRNDFDYFALIAWEF